MARDPNEVHNDYKSRNAAILNQEATEFNGGEYGSPQGPPSVISQDTAGAKLSLSTIGDDLEDDVTDEDIEVAERKADAETQAFAAKEAAFLKKLKSKAKHKNPLERYASVNHLWSLGALSSDEINFPKTTYRRNGIRPEHMVIRAGGLGDARFKKQTTLGENLHDITTEYFIDNIDIKHVVAPDKRTRNTNAYEIDFEVIEPYSMGQFLQSLQLAAMKAGYRNYLDCPYLLEYSAVGYKQSNATGVSADTVYTKYIPIKLRDMKFEVKEGGSTYVVVAIPWNEEALTDENQSLPVDVEISGFDLEQCLQSGLNSLATQVNTHFLNRAKENKSPVEPDEIMILFPTDLASEKFSSVEQGTDNTALSGDALEFRDPSEIDVNGAIESIGGVGFAKMFQDNSDFGARIIEQQQNFIEKRTGFSIRRNNLSEALKKTFVNTGAAVNYIGKKQIFTGDPLQHGNTNFAVNQFAYDEKTKTLRRGSTAIDPSQRTVNFTKGTKIQRIIEELVTISDFGKRLMDGGPRADSFGFVDWFRIQTHVYVLDSPQTEGATGRLPRIFVYMVKPYRVHSSTFLMPNDAPFGYNIMRARAEKEYNYIYTGINKDVLQFDIDFKTAFFKSIAGDKGNRSASNDLSSTGKQLDEQQNETQGDPNSFIGSTPTKSREIGVISETESGNQTGGAGKESPAVRVARSFQDALVNSKEDLISGTLTIMGDPYYVCDNGLGNYNTEAEDLISIDRYGNMNYENGQVDIILNFSTPVDLGNKYIGIKTADSFFGIVPQFSGLYFVYALVSSWRNGQFTQELKITRRPNQDESYAQLNKKKIDLTLEQKKEYQRRLNAALESGNPVAIARARADVNADGDTNPLEVKTFEYYLAIEKDKAEKVKAQKKREESLTKAGEDPNKWFNKGGVR